MKKKIISKGIALIMLLIIAITSASNIVLADTEISGARNIKNKGLCEYHLQYWNESTQKWSYIICHYVVYEEGGKEYPAYCLQRDLHGVGDEESYDVDITKHLDDVRVWRAIINGFPYKTPSELGLDNDYDAFLATKQAVYCVLYDWDAASRYRGADERGTRIANAIVNISNAGKYGTETPYSGGVEISKVGELYEDGDFYSQEYKTDCGANIEKYYIAGTSGMPEGSQIVNMNNNESTEFNGNEHFKVRIPKSKMNKDIDLAISIRAKARIYPVFFGKTRIEGTQDYALTFDPYGDVAGKMKLQVKTNNGIIKIYKKDKDTKQPLKGVEFQLKNEDGNVINTGKTDANGTLVFSNLYQGNYSAIETATNEEYILNTEIYKADVQYSKETDIEIENEHKKGNLKLYKVDADNNKISLGNVEFDLYSDELKGIVGTYYTDENGEITVNNLRTGSYKWIEKKTNKWYNLANDTEVKVEWNKTKEATVKNELKKGRIKVIKVDAENNEVKLQGVKFNVLDENNNVLETIVTDENGEATTLEYAVRDFGKLKIQETETLQEYVLNDEIQTIELKENQITNIKFENRKIRGNVELTKTDNDGNKLTGCKFNIYKDSNNNNTFDKDDELIGELEEKETGKYSIEQLLYGKYFIKEMVAPEGYVKSNEIIEVMISKDKETKYINMINKKVEITKKDLVTGDELPGAELEVKDNEGNIVDKWTSTITPHVVKGLEEGKEYTLTETTCPYGYEQAESIVFTVSQDKATQKIEMLDKPILKNIKLVKIDSDTKEIIKSKFKFGLYEDEECTKLIKEVESNKKEGTVLFEDLRYNTYYIKEISAPKEYELSNDVVKLEINDEGVFTNGTQISENDGMYSFEFENQKIPKIQTGNEISRVGLISSIVISLLGISTGVIILKRKKD